MKTAAIQKLRRKLAADRSTYGLWVTLESPSITEMAVALGMDWVVIDAEHGHLDWKDILEHLRATVRSDTVALVRIAELNIALIKRALDIGADGVVVPWIETADQLAQAIAFASFPPEGRRGIGAERATSWGQSFTQHTAEANENVLVIPIIESVTGGRNIEELCKVEGAEIFFIGPADYSSSAGYRGQWEGPGISEQIQKIKDTVRGYGKYCGVTATSEENLVDRRHQGFRLLGLGMDSALFLRSLRSALAAVGQDRRILPNFAPDEARLPAKSLASPPESVRPDRPEVMNKPGKNRPMELAPGVSVDTLVGQHNGARKLSTSFVTFEAGSRLPYHTHPVSESLTVIRGSVIVAIEGREHTLGVLDNILIPRGTAHSTRNDSALAALAHVAMATETPSRDLVSTTFETKAMSPDSKGFAGKERVTRFKTAPRSEAGPSTSFIDYFNSDLLGGVEMSGGYGLFQPGGRLPAHFHDFDESICIIEGTATCVVEGRRYQLADGGTALQPRGRVHYFINESPEPMAMIWVYAGPLPERVVVDERCALSDPWSEKK
jgi:2-keto-3-deoxy-L-rhamnonate aldolase RhmA/quercetin dioxygenase-like cupin family protein